MICFSNLTVTFSEEVRQTYKRISKTFNNYCYDEFYNGSACCRDS